MSVENLAGQTLSQYELREMLGAGGMGAVYRAYQANLKREVAVKILPTQLAMQTGYVERFNREAETAAALEHAHIIPVYDYGVQNGTAFIVMRLLTGGSLAERLALREGHDYRLPSLGEIADLLNQVAGALDYAHSQGVIHRDIKPGNILFDNQGSAYLADFGIAKLVDATQSLTETGRSVGTPTFMAPEQWQADMVVPATDQYALGIMTYLMIAGRLPFEASSAYALMNKHVNEQPPPLTALQPTVPEALELVLQRALAKKPEDRFPTVTAFAQSFSRAIEGNTGKMTNIFRAPLPTRPAPIRPAANVALPSSTLHLAYNPNASAITAPATLDTPHVAHPAPRPRRTGLGVLLAVLIVVGVSIGIIRPPALMALFSPAVASPTVVASVIPSATAAQVVLVVTPTLTPITPTPQLAIAAVVKRTSPTVTITALPTNMALATDAPIVATPANAISANNEWTPQIKMFDGVSMVLVPPGCFMMGSTALQVAGGGDKFSDEVPQSQVCFIKAFYLDQTPVWQAQFTQFTGQMVSSVAFPGQYLPVESITWGEALTYCTVNRHMRLPTEAEWEYAARGPDDLLYPWGNTFDATKAVYADNSNGMTAPVNRTDRIAPSWVGATDLNGNVSQWTLSLYQPYPYVATDGRESLTDTTGQRAFRGGSFQVDAATIHAAVRAGGDPTAAMNDVGLRCAQDVPTP